MKTYTFTEEQLKEFLGRYGWTHQAKGKVIFDMIRWGLCTVTVKDDTPPPRTVRVRIAVAATKSGCWDSCGASFVDPDKVARELMNSQDDIASSRLSWVEADVPLPEEPATIQGEVVP